MDTLLMDGLAQTAEQQSAADPWRDFAPGVWRRSVDVRDFIQRNLCPYEGDAGFVAGPTARTTALFAKVTDLLKQERAAKGGVLDADTEVFASITSHAAGYIDPELEVIVGLQTDKPLKRDELAASHLVQFPQVVISIVPVVHLPGIKAGQLVLNGQVLSKIFLGQITRWNDPAIKALNPSVPLPNMAVLVVHRADGSGTTFNFADYLGKVNPEWASKVGADTSIEWPVGVGGKGNAGVAGTVQQTVGSIGYVEYAYAKQSNMVWTDMINQAGKRVQPTMAAFQSAAANADFTKVQDFYLILTNQPGNGSWPITAATYMLMRDDYAADRNKGVLQFLDYALHEGAGDAEKLDYVPFPDSVVKQIEASWSKTLKVTP